MVASSLCMYSLEHEAQPEQFENAFSAIWWSVSTLLTVGYGDISRQELIVMIQIKNKVIIPNGSTFITKGDAVHIYSKKEHSEEL